MPVVVDLPDVPPTATRDWRGVDQFGQQFRPLDLTAQPSVFAATMSGTVSSTAAEVTSIWLALVTPEPSCGWRPMPRAFRKSNFAAVRPASSDRSDPSTS